jgi:type I restriction enzyme, S subunit
MDNKHSNIPQGYKDSSLGVIPKNWEVKRLGELGSFLKGKGVPKDKITTSGYKCLTYGDIYTKYDIFLENIRSFIDEETAIISEEIRTGDILFAGSGETLEDIGKTVVYLDNDKAYAGGDIIILRQNKVNSLFLSYLLNSAKSNAQKYQIGQGHSVVHIYSSQLANLLISIPPLPEQNKIAYILSVWDRSIDIQTRLIASLQTRKRALMQQLLTGNKRLKGFSGEWKIVKLGDVGVISSAGVDKKTIEGEIPVRLVNFLDVYRRDYIYSNELNHWVTASKAKIEKCSVQKGDIFFTPSSEVSNDIAISAVAMEDIPDAVYSYHVVRLRLIDNWDLKYRAYAFKTDDFYKQAETLCDGSGQRYVISQSKFRNMTVNVPPILEQFAIAEILSSADMDIDLANCKLTKMKEQKKGLMQQLLTGKKRVL